MMLHGEAFPANLPDYTFFRMSAGTYAYRWLTVSVIVRACVSG